MRREIEGRFRKAIRTYEYPETEFGVQRVGKRECSEKEAKTPGAEVMLAAHAWIRPSPAVVCPLPT